ncbi:hypothetical protein ACFXTI_043780 [Malus domestica]
MQQDPPTGQAPKVRPIQQVVVKLIVDPVIKEPVDPRLTIAPVFKEAATLAKKNIPLNLKTETVIILEEEDDNSKDIPLTSRLRPTKSLTINSSAAVEATDQVDPSTADRGKMPLVEPKPIAETPIHP